MVCNESRSRSYPPGSPVSEVWDTIALYIGLFSDYALFMLKVPQSADAASLRLLFSVHLNIYTQRSVYRVFEPRAVCAWEGVWKEMSSFMIPHWHHLEQKLHFQVLLAHLSKIQTSWNITELDNDNEKEGTVFQIFRREVWACFDHKVQRLWKTMVQFLPYLSSETKKCESMCTWVTMMTFVTSMHAGVTRKALTEGFESGFQEMRYR